MIEGSLSDALARGGEADEDPVRKLSGLLLAVDRYGTVEQLYCTSRMSLVFAVWEECSAQQQAQQQQGATGGSCGSSSSAVSWLPAFNSRLLSILEGQHNWCGKVLPQLQQRLLGSLLEQVGG